MKTGRIEPTAQQQGGSHHYVRDMQELAALDLSEKVTWAEAINILRALTFPPHQNIVVEKDGARYTVRLEVERVL